MTKGAAILGAVALVIAKGSGAGCRKSGGSGFDGSGIEELTPARGDAGLLLRRGAGPAKS